MQRRVSALQATVTYRVVRVAAEAVTDGDDWLVKDPLPPQQDWVGPFSFLPGNSKEQPPSPGAKEQTAQCLLHEGFFPDMACVAG